MPRNRLPLLWLVLLLITLAGCTPPNTHDAARAVPTQNALDAELMMACYKVDLSRVEAAIDAGADLNRRAGDWLQSWIDDPVGGRGPLTWRFIRGYRLTPMMAALHKFDVDPLDRYDITICLLDAGADPEAADMAGATVLQYAIDGRASLVALRLIRRGVEVNTMTEVYIDGDQGSPLWQAVRRDDGDVIQALLETGADPNVPSQFGSTPLIEAINRGALLRLLIEHGADVNQPTPAYTEDHAGRPLEWATSPLLIAITESSREVVDLLIEAGANVGNPEDLRAVPSDEIYSIYRHDSWRTRRLIELGVPPFQSTDYGSTPLHTVARDPMAIDILDILLKVPGVPLELGSGPKGWGTPLVHAYQVDNLTAGQRLLAAGASPDAVVPFQDRSLLSTAIDDGKTAWVALLRGAGATPE